MRCWVSVSADRFGGCFENRFADVAAEFRDGPTVLKLAALLGCGDQQAVRRRTGCDGAGEWIDYFFFLKCFRFRFGRGHHRLQKCFFRQCSVDEDPGVDGADLPLAFL